MLSADASSCPDFTTSEVGPQPPGCPRPLATSSNSFANSLAAPSSASENPVGYLQGIPVQSSTDLSTKGFDRSVDQTRSWSGVNQTGVAGNGWVVGSDPYLMVYNTFNPQSGTGDNPMVAFVQGGQSGSIFEVGNGGGTWVNRYFNRQTLSYNPATDVWTLIDAVGNRLEFADLPRNSAGDLSTKPADGSPGQGMFGKLTRRIDAGGQVTDYAYTAAGLLQTVTRIDAADGSAEQLQRSYVNVTNTLGGSASLLGSVTLARRPSASSAWTAIRTATYDYYNGEGIDAAHGRLGDLKLVTIRDGGTSGGIIDQKYYRYYKLNGYSRNGDTGPTGNLATMGGTDTTYPRETTAWNDPFFNVFQPADNTVTSGLKMVVENESFARMAAAVPNFLNASDSDLQPFVDNFYTYDRWADSRWNYATYANADFAGGYHYYTRYRVATEISQGAGCSTCSGGNGEYRFEFHVNPSTAGNGNAEYDPNVWRLRVIEILPDATPSDPADNDRVVVYINEVGQVLLKNLVETANVSITPTTVVRAGKTITVTSAQNGPNTGDKITTVNDRHGREIWRRDADGFIHHAAYAATPHRGTRGLGGWATGPTFPK